jgi:hypothetical protein
MSATKNLENNQFARTSDSTGKRTAFVNQSDQGIEPLSDNNGRLIVRIADDSGFIILNPTYSNYRSGALLAGDTISAASANLIMIYGFNNSAGTRYLQIFNRTSAPSPGNVPDISILVPTATQLSLSLPGVLGQLFNTGIRYQSSTTPATFTAGGADFWINSVYIAN